MAVLEDTVNKERLVGMDRHTVDAHTHRQSEVEYPTSATMRLYLCLALFVASSLAAGTVCIRVPNVFHMYYNAHYLSPGKTVLIPFLVLPDMISDWLVILPSLTN